MTISQHPVTTDDRRQLEELYRQQISAVRTLARLLGYPCPIADRAERRNPVREEIDKRCIMGDDIAYPSQRERSGGARLARTVPVGSDPNFDNPD